jgi:hypothetical protein
LFLDLRLQTIISELKYILLYQPWRESYHTDLEIAMILRISNKWRFVAASIEG